MAENVTFSELGLSESILKSLTELGYESPSPIQEATIPLMQEGGDLIGQAQTGTGKTGAFALPVLDKIDLSQRLPQVLVLTPTRELAIQVAEAFRAYARFIDGFHVLPIYGGHSYSQQIKHLKRGVHVVVGTPGRILDHLGRKTLDLSRLSCLVLDEADEMLRMGFIDDVEAIMSAASDDCQKAMFSATMPAPIAKIAREHLHKPSEVKIAAKTTTVERIEQQYLMLKNDQKLEALTRILEAEQYDALIIFVRTRSLTVELSEKLEARGHAAAPLNGDMNQAHREQTIRRLKSGQLDMVVATDVAARGLDVERISLVVNYDIPLDTEAYVHRIGRTGRAGRDGKAILLTTPREKRLLYAIEKATRQRLTPMPVPSLDLIAQRRADNFTAQVAEVLSDQPLTFYNDFLTQLQERLEVSSDELAAALLYIAQQENPLKVDMPELQVISRDQAGRERFRRDRDGRDGGRDRDGGRRRRDDRNDANKQTFRIEVGRTHGLQVSDVVGAIANEAQIDAQLIGRIRLFDEFSTVDLPKGMPQETMNHLKRVTVRGRRLSIAVDQHGERGGERRHRGSRNDRDGGGHRGRRDRNDRHDRGNRD